MSGRYFALCAIKLRSWNIRFYHVCNFMASNIFSWQLLFACGKECCMTPDPKNLKRWRESFECRTSDRRINKLNFKEVILKVYFLCYESIVQQILVLHTYVNKLWLKTSVVIFSSVRWELLFIDPQLTSLCAPLYPIWMENIFLFLPRTWFFLN